MNVKDTHRQNLNLLQAQFFRRFSSFFFWSLSLLSSLCMAKSLPWVCFRMNNNILYYLYVFLVCYFFCFLLDSILYFGYVFFFAAVVVVAASLNW